MKKSIKILLILFSLSVLGTNALATNALAGEIIDDQRISDLKKSLDEKISKDPIVKCKDNLFPRYDLEVVEFLEFLDTNFQNKSADSSLVDIAISRFAQYKRNLNQIFASLVPGAQVGELENLNTDEIAAYKDCSKIKQAYLDLAKTQMIEHIKNTNAQKRSTIIVEKYQAINNRLRELNVQIAKMYGLLVAFKEKLPFFVANCVTQ